MIELLVVVVLLGIMLIIGVLGIQRYLSRGQDAQRKAHLQTYRTVLEEYFTDNGRYPVASTLLNCGANTLNPYMPEILCDPVTKTPYLYVPSPSGLDYVLYAQLVNQDDPDISQYGCENGCGPDHNSDGAGDFSIGVSNGKPIRGEGSQSYSTPDPDPQVEPTPKPPSGCGSWCYANQCTTCCGAFYRCAEDGQTCVPDNSCDPCPNGVCTGGDGGDE